MLFPCFPLSLTWLVLLIYQELGRPNPEGCSPDSTPSVYAGKGAFRKSP
uniref:Uncharacterized protein n=1 Tax=Utricularia reniformis TaxID=192314 RepID=A0A1Y0B0E5_9LAMI|nr:hypothetical protein AEK19_MT0665 [Utricularia reniformis]ART30916.1 hypothetical protein AEK19_MT0665 [Utricularia reniformis]